VLTLGLRFLKAPQAKFFGGIHTANICTVLM